MGNETHRKTNHNLILDIFILSTNSRLRIEIFKVNSRQNKL